MQMASMGHYLSPIVSFSFINGAFPAQGPPDPMVSLVYKDMEYFEWLLNALSSLPHSLHQLHCLLPDSLYLRSTREGCDFIGMNDSVQRVLDYLDEHGPFVGILGFSQGAAVATRVLCALRQSKMVHSLRFVVLIGGVTPRDAEKEAS